jgi:hypothetical protein
VRLTILEERRLRFFLHRTVGRAVGLVNGGSMTIKITEHIDLPPVYICPTCLKPTPFQAGEHWQVCEEYHFAEVRAVTFANGEARLFLSRASRISFSSVAGQTDVSGHSLLFKKANSRQSCPATQRLNGALLHSYAVLRA